jgi:hypothetical protein
MLDTTEISTSRLLKDNNSRTSSDSSKSSSNSGSGIFGACCNFINCVIGAGIIGTGGGEGAMRREEPRGDFDKILTVALPPAPPPHPAVAESGYTISMVMLLLCALLTKYSLDLLIEVRKKAQRVERGYHPSAHHPPPLLPHPPFPSWVRNTAPQITRSWVTSPTAVPVKRPSSSSSGFTPSAAVSLTWSY